MEFALCGLRMMVDAVTGDSIQHRGDARDRPQQAEPRGEGRADPLAVAVGWAAGRGSGARAIAAAPSGLEPGSPFGQSIAAVVVYLHYAHAIGLERLAALMGEIFAL